MIPVLQILFHATALIAFLILSRESSPFWRTLKIILSMPLITVLSVDMSESIHWMASASEMEAAPARLVAILVLTMIWGFDVATWVSARVANLVEMHGTEGFRADYHDARKCRSEGDLERAIQLTRKELAKTGGDFEGVMLVADLFLEMGRPKRAIPFLVSFVRRGVGTEFQLATANARLDSLRASRWFARFRGTKPTTIRPPEKGSVRLRSEPSDDSVKIRR